jgi:hypothetical protein
VVVALAAGFWLGRSADGPTGDPRSRDVVAEQAELPMPYRVIVDEHFRATEALLSRFTAAPEPSDELAGVASDLLAATRLLKASRAGRDAEVERLLEDVELLLAQLARLVDSSRAAEREIVREGIETSAVLPRLRELEAERPGPDAI